MRIVRNSILLLFTFILVFTIPLLVFFQSINSTILKPYNTEMYFQNSGIYKDLEGVFENDLKENFNSTLNKPDSLTIQIVNTIIEKHITDDSISYIIKGTNDSIWDYIIGKTDVINNVDMKNLNDSMSILIEHEVKEYSEETGLPMELLAKDLINYAENKMPKYFNFMSAFNLQVDQIDNLKQLFYKSRQVLFFLYMIILTTILIGLITTGRLYRGLKWISTNFLISGFLSLVPASVLIIYKDDLFNKIIFKGLLVDFRQDFDKLFTLVINDILFHIITISFMLIFIGFVLLLIRLFLLKEHEEKNNLIF